jgi:hypothetical protein
VRQFGSPGFRLWNLSLPAKALYTAFCLLTLLGIGSSMLYYEDLVGPTRAGIRRYYGKDGEAAEPSAPLPQAPPGGPARAPNAESSGGPAIELPPETASETQAPLVVAVTYRKLLEVTHFHLFTMPVVFLIVGHLFLATALADRTKFAWMVAGGVAVTLHLAAPWLIHYVSSGLAWLYALSGIALFVTMTVLTIYPAVVMWRTPPRRRDDADGP